MASSNSILDNPIRGTVCRFGQYAVKLDQHCSNEEDNYHSWNTTNYKNSYLVEPAPSITVCIFLSASSTWPFSSVILMANLIGFPLLKLAQPMYWPTLLKYVQRY